MYSGIAQYVTCSTHQQFVKRFVTGKSQRL